MSEREEIAILKRYLQTIRGEIMMEYLLDCAAEKPDGSFDIPASATDYAAALAHWVNKRTGPSVFVLTLDAGYVPADWEGKHE